MILTAREYRIIGPMLVPRDPDVAPLRLHWGHEITPRPIRTDADPDRQYHDVRLDPKATTRIEVRNDSGGKWKMLNSSLSTTKTVDGERIRVRLARSDADRRRCIALIAQLHYLSPRASGAFVLAERTRAGPDDPILGVVQLERLHHGAPKGRDYIYGKLGFSAPGNDDRNQEGFRAKQVRELGLVWISRVATSIEPRRIKGLATALVQFARSHASEVLANDASWIELIRIVDGETLLGLLSETEQDFLVRRSGPTFHLAPKPLSSRPGMQWDAASGNFVRRSPTEVTADEVGPSSIRVNQDRDYSVYYFASIQA